MCGIIDEVRINTSRPCHAVLWTLTSYDFSKETAQTSDLDPAGALTFTSSHLLLMYLPMHVYIWAHWPDKLMKQHPQKYHSNDGLGQIKKIQKWTEDDVFPLSSSPLSDSSCRLHGVPAESSSMLWAQCGVPFLRSSRVCRPSWRPKACCVPTLWAVSVAVMSIWAYLVEGFPVKSTHNQAIRLKEVKKCR